MENYKPNDIGNNVLENLDPVEPKEVEEREPEKQHKEKIEYYSSLPAQFCAEVQEEINNGWKVKHLKIMNTGTFVVYEGEF